MWKWVFYVNSKGTITRQGFLGEIPETLLGQYTTTDEAIGQAPMDSLTITTDLGLVTGVTLNTPDPEVWLHITIAGGDGEDILGANLDGSNPLQVSAALRQTQNPTSAIIQVNRSYRITIRDTDGSIYDVRKITLVDGEFGPVNYSGNSHAAVCVVLEDDFESVEAGGNTYLVRLAQPVRFKFYHEL